MTGIIITGAKGRMGNALIACTSNFPDLTIVAGIDQGDDLKNFIEQADAVVDFSSPSATVDITAVCAHHTKSIVIGTTGHSEDERSQITQHQSEIPMVLSSNYSTG